MSLLRRMVDDTHSLDAMALLVRRAGLGHLVSDASPDEVQALADAGDRLFLERVACALKSLGNPAKALAPFDGGAALRAETKALAYEVSRRGG
jgi:hypothetical protein